MIARTADQPWVAIETGTAGAAAAPSMICDEERRYLSWLARDCYIGRGAIVDAGPLLGSSTIALAEGLRQNSRVHAKARRIHSYDLFEYQTYMRGLFEEGDEPVAGESLLPRYLSHIGPWRDFVEVHAGDVMEHAWTGGPIEILFIDLAKSWHVQTHLLREFFPSLIPGVSIVVQQDYFHHRCHWITLVMERLADYFTPVHAPGGATLGFALTRELPPALLQHDYRQLLSQPEAEALFDRAVSRFVGTRRLLTMTARVSMLLDYGDVAAAIEVLDAVRRSPDFDAAIRPDFLSAASRVSTLAANTANAAPPTAPGAPPSSMCDQALHRVELLIELSQSGATPIAAAQGDEAIGLMTRAAASGRALYLWGAGQGGRDLLRVLRQRRVPVAGFIDRDPLKTDRRIDELTISPPDRLDPAGRPRPFIGVASIFAAEIVSDLSASGWLPDLDYIVFEPCRSSTRFPNPFRDSGYYQAIHEENAAYQQNNWLLEEIDRLTAFGAGSILELACGNGRFLDLAASRFQHVYGCDWAVSPLLSRVLAEHGNVSFYRTDLYEGVPPCQAELVVSADFLEHLAPERLDEVLPRIDALAPQAFHKIACYDDGHSHLSVFEPAWWLERLRRTDSAYQLERVENRFGDPARQIAIFVKDKLACMSGPGTVPARHFDLGKPLPGRDEVTNYFLERYDASTLLDVGCGSGPVWPLFAARRVHVTGIDLVPAGLVPTAVDGVVMSFIEGDFMQVRPQGRYSAVYSSHTIEHAPDTEAFLTRFFAALEPGGAFCLIWPPPKPFIVSGHVHIFNFGLMLYNLVRLGVDCREIEMVRCGYCLALMGRHRTFELPALTHNEGDIDRLGRFFPFTASQGFDGDNPPGIVELAVTR